MINSLILTGPLLVLIFSAVFCVLFRNFSRIQLGIALAGTLTYFFSALLLITTVYKSGIQAVQIGNWPAPFGITLVADLLSCMMVMIAAIMAIPILIYAIEDIDQARKNRGFFPVFFFLLLGVNGTFLTGDIFNLYVWFEVMMLSSFVLISLGNTKPQLEGSVKYVVLNLIASGFLVAGVAVLYRSTGALNMAHLALIIREQTDTTSVNLAALFFFLSFGIKSAVFPLYMWLPASYHTPPVTISALLAALLTKLGVYALIRFFTLLFIHDISYIHLIMLVIAGLTMLTGVLGAIAQNEMRKLLAFHIVSQIGYMIMGLAIFTPLALAGAIFFIIHNIFSKTALFFISGLVHASSGTFLLNKVGGFHQKFPFVTLLFVVSALSLAGIPPFPGFWGKLMLVKAGLEVQSYGIIAIALLTGLLTLFSMTKIWLKVFWSKARDENYLPKYAWGASGNPMTTLFRAKHKLILPVIILVLMMLMLSIYPEFLINLSNKAAGQLLNPEEYIRAVLK